MQGGIGGQAIIDGESAYKHGIDLNLPGAGRGCEGIGRSRIPFHVVPAGVVPNIVVGDGNRRIEVLVNSVAGVVVSGITR